MQAVRLQEIKLTVWAGGRVKRCRDERDGYRAPHMASARLFRVILPVRDIERAVHFYSHLFDDEGERVSPGRHYYRCGEVILTCYSPVADGDAVSGGWHHHENQLLYFAVPDLAVVRERIEQAGGMLVTSIEDMPWGERLFYAVDPEGVPLSFVDERTVFTGTR